MTTYLESTLNSNKPINSEINNGHLINIIKKENSFIKNSKYILNTKNKNIKNNRNFNEFDISKMTGKDNDNEWALNDLSSDDTPFNSVEWTSKKLRNFDITDEESRKESESEAEFDLDYSKTMKNRNINLYKKFYKFYIEEGNESPHNGLSDNECISENEDQQPHFSNSNNKSKNIKILEEENNNNNLLSISSISSSSSTVTTAINNNSRNSKFGNLASDFENSFELEANSDIELLPKEEDEEVIERKSYSR